MVDQPDAVYLTATISTDYDYVIEGTRADQVYFSCESRAALEHHSAALSVLYESAPYSI